MKPTIKAIETVYDGHLFRSRLEARWAVFFKSVGLKYEYELEGYDLGDGVKYLPDFYLPDLKLHVEVKPNRDLSHKDIEKIVRFSADHDNQLLLIVGTPEAEEMFIVNRYAVPPWEDYAVDMQVHADVGDPFSLQESFFSDLCPRAAVAMAYTISGYSAFVYKLTPPHLEQKWTDSLSKAKQARFEHGKKGN